MSARIITGLVSLVLFAIAGIIMANAADLRSPFKLEPVPGVAVDEALGSGIYLGATVGYGAAIHDVTATVKGGGKAELDGIGGDGVTLGLIGGYEFAAGRLRVGPIAMYDFGELESELKITGIPSNTSSFSDLWTVGATVGVTLGAAQQSELFVLAGYSGAHWELKGPGIVSGRGLRTEDDPEGWTAGLGLKTKLGAGVELIVLGTYTDLDDVTVFQSPGVTVKDDGRIWAGKAGLVYKIGNIANPLQ